LVAPSLSCPAYSLVPAQKPSTQSPDEFDRFSSRNSARSAVAVPIRKDRDVEKTRTRTRTLSGVKSTAPGSVPNEEDIINPDASFFLLNLGPLDGEPASPTDSERAPHLHLPSLIIFLPHHHRHSSFSERLARSHPVLGIVNGVPSSGLVLSPQTPNLGCPY
jgi:hypothetical protein